MNLNNYTYLADTDVLTLRSLHDLNLLSLNCHVTIEV